jgi:hypothetical protein
MRPHDWSETSLFDPNPRWGVAVQHFTSLEFRQYLLPQQSELIASETTLQFGHFENTK